MHGIHDLQEEYKGNIARIQPPLKSCNSFLYNGTRLKSKSSPASRRAVLLKRLRIAIVWTLLLLLVVAATSLLFGTGTFANLLKAHSQRFSTVNLVKRSEITSEILKMYEMKKPQNPKTLQAHRNTIQLIVSLVDDQKESLNLFKQDDSTWLSVPTKNSTSPPSLTNSRIILDSNSTSIFEAILFAYCNVFGLVGHFPTKLTVIGRPKTRNCAMGRYRWAMKIPEDRVKFRSSNSTSFDHLTKCSSRKDDPFDCHSSNHRWLTRFQYSKICPDLAPFLLACDNHITLNRALEFTPPWARKQHTRDRY